MTDRRQIFNAAQLISDSQLAEMGQQAQVEKDRLLARYPHLEPLQQEIDRRLAAAGATQNRLAVLGFMMEAKLSELREHLDTLKGMATTLAQAR